jgi:hypothetical protein
VTRFRYLSFPPVDRFGNVQLTITVADAAEIGARVSIAALPQTING